MTKEEFYHLAYHKPEIKAKSIHILTIRSYRSDISGYEKTPGEEEWSFPIYKFHRFYSSLEEAEKAMHDYIKSEDIPIHSCLIERETIDTNVDNAESLEWWSYDSAGQLIMKSLCTPHIPEYDKLTIDNIYMGRPVECCPFKMGQIVEVVSDDTVHLEVLIGIPPTVDERWERYEECVKRRGSCQNEGPYFSDGYFADAMADQFFYLRADVFDPDIPPETVYPLTFTPSEDAVSILNSRYNHWKTEFDKNY